MNYLIIGNSMACVGAIEGIRKSDKESNITVVSDEKYFVYGRPLISYLLQGKTSEEKMNYRPRDFYVSNNVELRLEERVISIDKENKIVKTTKGEISYDKLLISTGSRAFVPPTQGLDTVKNKFVFMTLDDAKVIDKVINKDTKVLIIGAGLIGLKCAEGVYERVKRITVVDMTNRVLPSILDERGSKMVLNHLTKKGVVCELNNVVEKYDGNKAYLKDGKCIEFDILVTAVGVRPNVELLKEIGGHVEKGIIVDKNGMTSIQDIYAAGDCCESYDISFGGSRILALLPNAYMQGHRAGICMTGGKEIFDNAIPMNSIGIFGLHIITAGSYDGEYDTVEYSEENYKVLIKKDNILKGLIIIGDVSRAGIYISLIRNKKDLSEIDYNLIRNHAQLMAFSQKERLEKLGGVK